MTDARTPIDPGSEPLALRLQRGRGPMGVVAGLAAGVLIAALVIPETQDTSSLTAQDTSGVSAQGSEGGTAADTGSAEAGSLPAGDTPTAVGSQDATPSAAASTGAANGGGASASPRSGPLGGATGGAPATESVSANVRGVTAGKIRIGVGLPDISAIAALGPGYDDGDQRKQMEAVLDGWKRQGLVPVHGRDVEFVYREYNILSAEQARAACIGFVQDDKVFAVIAVHNFAASECVAGEFRTPLLVSNAPGDLTFQRAHPYLYALEASASRILRNWPHWAERRGLLRGKTIGLYMSSNEQAREEVARTFTAELKKLGYKIAVEVTTDSDTGGPTDAVAVQRFKAAGVDLVVLVLGLGRTSFLQQAEAQNYRPTYIANDLGYATTDTGAGTHDPNQWDGTYGMTGMRYGEAAGGIPAPPEALACIANYERYSGRRGVTRESREAEWIATNQGCDEARVMLYGLQKAGRNLTPATLVAALDSLTNMQQGIHSNTTFTPKKHDGGNLQRTLQWSRGCTCWKALSPFENFFLP